MKEIEELKERLLTESPTQWESLPDLALYMDQVIGYMSRQLICWDGEDRLTSAMVNNYIKDHLLPRAEGKRYSKAHLAYLTQICALKQVLPVKDAGLLADRGGEETIQARYGEFIEALRVAMKDTADRLPDDCTQAELADLALELALHSYADKLACQRIIAMLREETGEGEKPSKKNKKAEKG